MTNFVECGDLPIGIIHQGKLCKEYKLRALRVRHSIDAKKLPDFARCEGDDELMGLLSFAMRLEIDGIPSDAMTIDLMLDLFDDDMSEIISADGRLKEKIARFRSKDQETDDADLAKDENPLACGQENGASAST